MTEPSPRPGAASGSCQNETRSWWSPRLRDELEAIYREADREIRDTGAVCWLRGDCCDFDRTDHVLFASAIEIAYVEELRPGGFPAGSKLCPYWKDRLCTLRERRPLGCRTYFCDPRFREVLEAIHEKHLRRLKEAAERHRAPWGYVPFVAALRRADGVCP